MIKKALDQSGKFVKQKVGEHPQQWRGERDIWAIGIVLASTLAWLDVHPPEGLTLAMAYLIIRIVQILRRN